MSTLTHHDTGTSLSQRLNTLPVDDAMSQHIAQIPRSVLVDSNENGLKNGVSHTSSDLDTQGPHSLRMAVTLTSQSHPSWGNAHEGRTTNFVVPNILYAGNSKADTFQAVHDSVSGTSQAPARRGSAASTATTGGPSSPRKPIPSQWLPVNSSPNFATAQRAKQRDRRMGSVNGSPVDSKTLGSARSLTDLKKTHAADGVSFLTKTAYRAVESDITSPPTARSPTKHHRTSSKPAWNSPTGSPLRDSTQQQPHLIIKTSPVRAAVPNAGVGSQRHRRGDSVATSTGDTVYHSAESSPVRGSVEAKSPPETLEHVPKLPLSADNEYKQASTGPSQLQTATGISTKPSLKIVIPATDSSITTSDQSAGAYSSTSGSSPWSPTSAPSLSRIPRAAGTSATSARGPTLSSSLKRVQPAKSLASLKAKADVQTKDTLTMQMETTPTTTVRHAHFIDTCDSPQNSTKHTIMHPTPRLVPSTAASDVSPVSALGGSDSEEAAATMPEQANFSKPASECSRASSLSTIKAAPSYCDPILADSAIIYSKKPGVCGTILDQPPNVSPIIVMMAHNVDIGTFNKGKEPLDAHDTEVALVDASFDSTSPVRGRAAQFVPTPRRQAESSEHSLHSSLSSDLRATAPEFVPYPSASAQQESTAASAPQQLEPPTDLLGPMKYELDMYGIPWFYYMYQVQIAYEQGFQTGRAKSPKKPRQKKTNPARAQTSAEASKPPNKQHSSSMPPPASTVPLAEQRAQRLSELSNVEGAFEPHDGDGRITPFREQNDLIDAHSALGNMVITDRPLPGIDVTSIRNVPEGPRHAMQPHHRNQHRRSNTRSDNGLYTYHGRGMPMGLRMHDTAPFPAPVPPPGRPVRVTDPGRGCGVVDIVYAAENVGGDACFDCEPDHPLD